MTRQEEVMLTVLTEIRRADAKYGPPASSHESLGVIAEEWDELRDAIRQNDIFAIQREAIQVAASALRLAIAANAREPGFVERSGCE